MARQRREANKRDHFQIKMTDYYQEGPNALASQDQKATAEDAESSSSQEEIVFRDFDPSRWEGSVTIEF